MEPFGKLLKEVRKTLEKEHERPLSGHELTGTASFLKLLAELAVEHAIREQAWLKKLEEHPQGFHPEGAGYTCPICHYNVSENGAWYDRHGLKCMTCQKALDERVIPASLMKKPDSFYTESELDYFFNLKKKMLNNWVKKGLLVARTVPEMDGRNKGAHIRLFLRSDNKGFLPPKRLLKGGMHMEEADGRDECVFGPWYWYCDPFKKLAKYGIVQHLRWEPA